MSGKWNQSNMVWADLCSRKPRGDWTNWKAGEVKQLWWARLRAAFLWFWWGNVHNKLTLTSLDALYLPLPGPTDEGLKNSNKKKVTSQSNPGNYYENLHLSVPKDTNPNFKLNYRQLLSFPLSTFKSLAINLFLIPPHIQNVWHI